MEKEWQDQHIVFYDGDCGMCNFWVQWILERDEKNQFMFASLQSQFGQSFLKERGLDNKQFNTLYLWKPGEYYLIKSKAVFRIAKIVGGIYQLASIGDVLPLSISDSLYDMVAKNRKKIGNQHCLLPTAEQKKKFINN